MDSTQDYTVNLEGYARLGKQHRVSCAKAWLRANNLAGLTETMTAGQYHFCIKNHQCRSPFITTLLVSVIYYCVETYSNYDLLNQIKSS